MAIPNIEALLNDNRPRLLLVAQTEGQVCELATTLLQCRSSIGIIGNEFPFLANLNVVENILLGTMYHNNLPLEEAFEPLREDIEALGVMDVMRQRKNQLNTLTRMKCQLLRCIACGNTIVLVHTGQFAVAQTLLHALEMLRQPPAMWIACSAKNALAYEKLNFPTFHIEE